MYFELENTRVITHSKKTDFNFRSSIICFLGGPNGNTLLSDTQSNTDRITLHSSR